MHRGPYLPSNHTLPRIILCKQINTKLCVCLDVGTLDQPTKHRFSGVPVRFLSRRRERRASLLKLIASFRIVEKTIVIELQPRRDMTVEQQRAQLPTARLAPKAHRLASKTQQRHCTRSSVTKVLSFEQDTPQLTSLPILLEMHEMSLNEMRYRTPSKLKTLF